MSATPKVGFVSLGCPKASSDSEQILTQLRAEGYLISKTYDDADLVVALERGVAGTVRLDRGAGRGYRVQVQPRRSA